MEVMIPQKSAIPSSPQHWSSDEDLLEYEEPTTISLGEKPSSAGSETIIISPLASPGHIESTSFSFDLNQDDSIASESPSFKANSSSRSSSSSDASLFTFHHGAEGTHSLSFEGLNDLSSGESGSKMSEPQQSPGLEEDESEVPPSVSVVHQNKAFIFFDSSASGSLFVDEDQIESMYFGSLNDFIESIKSFWKIENDISLQFPEVSNITIHEGSTLGDTYSLNVFQNLQDLLSSGGYQKELKPLKVNVITHESNTRSQLESLVRTAKRKYFGVV